MDDLDDYNSEEDEDYIYDGGASDGDAGFEDDEFGGPSVGGKGSSLKKRKKSTGLGSIVSRPGQVWKANKKTKTGVGAAVISDDEEEMTFNTKVAMPPPQPAKHTTTTTTTTAIPAVPAAKPAESESTATNQAASSAAADTASSQSAATAIPAPVPSSPSPSSPPPVSSPSTSLDFILSSSRSGGAAAASAAGASAAPVTGSVTPSTPTTPSTSTTNGSSQSLAQILANFQKPKTVLPTSTPSTTTTPNKSALPWEKKSSTLPVPSQTAAQASASAKLEMFLAKSAPKVPPKPVSSDAPTTTTSDGLSDDKIVVKEITSYAGETMEITKTILKGSLEDKLRQKASKDNLATLVASLTAKKSMSTLAKSAVDWQISKEEEGDSAELEKATKNGYVDKMAFLAKTDMRQFELEKEARNQARRIAEKKAAAGGAPTAPMPSEYRDEREGDDEQEHEEKEGTT